VFLAEDDKPVKRRMVPKLVMPRGARTVNIFYPGRIGMPERTAYLIRLADNIGSLLLYRHLKPVETLDFSNGLKRTENDGRIRWELQRPIAMAEEHNIAMESEGQLIYVFEDGVQYYRLFKPRNFTEIFIVHDVEDTTNLTDEEKSRHERIAERFLMAYRAFTGDISVRIRMILAPITLSSVPAFTSTPRKNFALPNTSASRIFRTSAFVLKRYRSGSILMF
jgi:hypothetical protein